MKFKLNNQLFAEPTINYDGGSTPANFTPNSVEDLGGMLCKIAEQVIREVTAEDKLSVFDKMPVDNGDTIEQAIVKLASPRSYDATGANALSRKTPDIAVRMFNDWTRLVFDTTVDTSQIRKVLKTGKGADELSTKIVASLSEGDRFSKYNNLKNLLAWGRQDGTGKVFVQKSNVEMKNGAVDFKETLVQMKNIISGMQYVNAEFNTASLKRRTLKDDIYLLIPYKLKNRLDVEELAGVFNLEKDKIEAHIIELDIDESDFGGKYLPIYIVDKWAILDYTRLYVMENQKNADGYFWNYFLHTERLYGISPLFDGCYFWVQTQAQAE
jgi:hypothetical protein